MNKTLFRAAAALLAVLCIAACHRRPLLEPSELVKISVEIDVDNISNITCDIYNDDPNLGTKSVTTDMMRVMVYDPSNGKLLTQSFISDKTINEKGHEVISGTLEIGAGDFDFLLKIYAPDMQYYNDFLINTLGTIESLGSVQSWFVMNEVKNCYGLPVSLL